MYFPDHRVSNSGQTFRGDVIVEVLARQSGKAACRKISIYLVVGRAFGTAPILRLRRATSVSRRTVGLLTSAPLGEHEGLWIKPCMAVHTMGMRFPIDVVFLNRERRVLRVVANLRPNRFAICWQASSVVELPAHYCSRYKYYAAAIRRATCTV